MLPDMTRTSPDHRTLPALSPANLALFEMQKPFAVTALTLCRAFNTALDLAFYDVNRLEAALKERGRTIDSGIPTNSPSPAKGKTVLDLTALINPSGSVIVVDANLAPYVREPYTDMKKFIEHANGPDGSGLHTLTVTGVGSSAFGSVALAWDVSAALGAPVAAVVPGYGVADVVPQALGGWFGFEMYNAIQSATQSMLAQLAPSLASIARELALSTPDRVHARTGAPVFQKGSAASDDVHAILEHVPGITRLVGHSKGALAIENAVRSLSKQRQKQPMDILTFGCVISEPLPHYRYFQSLGLIDGLGLLNSSGHKPDYRPMATHTTNTVSPFSINVSQIVGEVN